MQDFSLITSKQLHFLKNNIERELYERHDKSFRTVLKAPENGWWEHLYSLPKAVIECPYYSPLKMRFVPLILSQDWSFLFQNKDNTHKNYYVYFHLDPRWRGFSFSNFLCHCVKGKPIYVGKGKGNRAYTFKRNEGHGIILSQLISLGFQKNDLVQIVLSDLTEQEACALELKLIYIFQTVYENQNHGSLFNLKIEKRPSYFESYPKGVFPAKDKEYYNALKEKYHEKENYCDSRKVK